MWKQGAIGVPTTKNGGGYIYCKFWVKAHEDTESGYGINGGKIIKLMLKIGDEIVCNYDRGWDIKATCWEARFALKILLHEYN